MPKNCLSQTVGQFRKLQKCAVFPTPITSQTCSKNKPVFRLRNTLLMIYNIATRLPVSALRDVSSAHKALACMPLDAFPAGTVPFCASPGIGLSGQRVYPRFFSRCHNSSMPSSGFRRRISRMRFNSASVCWLGWLWGRLDWPASEAAVPSRRCFQKQM